MGSVRPPSGPGAAPDLRKLQEAAARAGVVLPEDALLAFQQGHLLEAIKRIRRANPGLDLARAKAVMGRMQANAARTTGTEAADTRKKDARMPAMGQKRPPTVTKGDPPGQVRWLLIVLALLASAAWIVFAGRV